MKEFWGEFFKFLKEILPNILLAFSVGKKAGEEGKDKIGDELRETKYELEKLKNKIAVEDANRGKSSLDILKDTIGESTRSDEPRDPKTPK